MKKLLLSFFGLSIMSCSSLINEEFDIRITDPLIGTWFIPSSSETDEGILIYNFNGTFVEDSSGLDAPIKGTWFNIGDNYNDLNQLYVFSYDDESEEFLVDAFFNNNFSQVELSNESEEIIITGRRIN